jgi:hypothetical protein
MEDKMKKKKKVCKHWICDDDYCYQTREHEKKVRKQNPTGRTPVSKIIKI